MDKVLISVGKNMRQKVIKNLLKAQERIADSGNAKENIRMAKFLLKTSKEFDNDIEQLSFKEDDKTGD